jgi:hypothetical protein
MKITYQSDRIKVWQDGTLYYSAYRVRKFLVFLTWNLCLPFYTTEEQAAAHASHMWFVENFVKGKDSGIVAEYVRSDGTEFYVAKRRFLRFFWKNISGRQHWSRASAFDEINLYFFRSSADRPEQAR